MLKSYDLRAVSTESLTAAQLRIDSGIETLILEIVNKGIECKGSPEQICRWSKNAGIEPKVGPKTPRKTVESWMLKSGIPEIEIYSRAGHDPITSLRHYQSLSFTDYEMRDITKRLTEWGILKQ